MEKTTLKAKAERANAIVNLIDERSPATRQYHETMNAVENLLLLNHRYLNSDSPYQFRQLIKGIMAYLFNPERLSDFSSSVGIKPEEVWKMLANLEAFMEDLNAEAADEIQRFSLEQYGHDYEDRQLDNIEAFVSRKIA